MDKQTIRDMVSSAIDKVYVGNTRENSGEIENHSTDYTHKYYSLLAKGDEKALEEQKQMIENSKKLNIDEILRSIDE